MEMRIFVRNWLIRVVLRRSSITWLLILFCLLMDECLQCQEQRTLHLIRIFSQTHNYIILFQFQILSISILEEMSHLIFYSNHLKEEMESFGNHIPKIALPSKKYNFFSLQMLRVEVKQKIETIFVYLC